MPVRNIPKNYRNVTGVAAHQKAQGKAMFESTLERDFLMLLEFDSDVVRFEVQPLTIDWVDSSGKYRKYTPDVLADFNSSGSDTKVLYEVKYRDEIFEKWRDGFHEKFRAAVKFAKSKGWRFKLISEVEIRTAYLENVKFLLPYLRRPVTHESHMELLENKLIELKESNPSNLIQHVFADEWNQAALLPTLWYMIATKQIGADLNQQLTMKSKIWPIL